MRRRVSAKARAERLVTVDPVSFEFVDVDGELIGGPMSSCPSATPDGDVAKLRSILAREFERVRRSTLRMAARVLLEHGQQTSSVLLGHMARGRRKKK